MFDNADELEAIAKYLPYPSTSCHLLITTRTTQSCELFREENTNVVILETLEESIAISALIGLAGKEKETLSPSELEAARKIAVEAPIEGLPIALRHAGAYLLRHEGVTFEAYWEKLVQEKRQLEAASLDLDKFLRYFRLSHLEEDLRRVGIKIPSDLLRFKIDDIDVNSFDRQSLANAVKKLRTTRHAFLTWEMDISDIEEKFPAAFSILRCCSVMMSKSISQEVISRFLSLVHGNFESLRLVEGLVSLKKYTLLNRDEFSDDCVYYSMHHLIHQSIFERLRQNKEMLEFVLDVTACALVDVINTEGHLSSARALHYYSVAKNMVVLGRLGSLHIARIRSAARCCYRCSQFNAFEELALMMISTVTNRPDFSERKKIKILRPCMLFLPHFLFVICEL